MDEDRIDFYFAAQEIERRFGLSPGEAQVKLREFCASGVVRSWKQPYLIEGCYVTRLPEEERERVLPSEWKIREVDLAPEVDGYGIFVDVSKVDLERQIGRGPNRRDAEIIRRLRERQRPGKNIGWKAFGDSIRKACDADCVERGFSDETIERKTKELQKKVGQIG